MYLNLFNTKITYLFEKKSILWIIHRKEKITPENIYRMDLKYNIEFFYFTKREK